ncbi:MAG: hypothetical protein KF726_24230 [Anaerolineae bacterium]|nr:hypothetical protein [Anaerolineae bacterium]
MGKLRLMIGVLLFMASISPLRGVAAAQQDECSKAFDDVNSFTAEVYAKSLANIENGVIVWDSTDWDNIVRRVVGTSEYFLNNCTDPDKPLIEQLNAVQQLAQLSQIKPPVESVNIGGDFGDVKLTTDFHANTAFIDLNGDGVGEFILNTQVPYFSDKTVYALRGGLNIAFFQTEDGWQGQVIAPVTSYVTDETGDHVSFAMTEQNTLSVTETHQALGNIPGLEIQVIDIAGQDAPLTFLTLHSSTGTGEAKELAVIKWDGRFPLVKLRVAFDDWCYPGSALDWQIFDDGSVLVPSNGGDAASGLHCGQTPEVLFKWDGERYTAEQQ